MKLSTTISAVVGAAAGLAVAVGAYQASSAVGRPPGETVNTSVGLQDSATSPVAHTQLADCEPPSHLVGSDCVTDVERTVVAYDDSRSHEATGAHEAHEDEVHHEDGPQEPEDD